MLHVTLQSPLPKILPSHFSLKESDLVGMTLNPLTPVGLTVWEGLGGVTLLTDIR